jgi:hypothetical protein
MMLSKSEAYAENAVLAVELAHLLVGNDKPLVTVQPPHQQHVD